MYIPKIYHGRNKTFFFTNFEKTEPNQLAFSGFATLPTPDFKKGDFSKLFDPAYTGNPLSGTQVGTDALGRPIIFGQIYDPVNHSDLANGTIVRDPFRETSSRKSQMGSRREEHRDRRSAFKIRRSTPWFETFQKIGTCCPFFHEHIVGVKDRSSDQ